MGDYWEKMGLLWDVCRKCSWIEFLCTEAENEGSELDQLVKEIIDKTATYEKLESHYFDNLAEAREN